MPADSRNFAQDSGELPLIYIWRVLARRWLWVLASVVVFLAVGAAYLKLADPIYQVSGKLQIGQVAGAGPFEAPESLASRMLAAHGEFVAEGVRRPRPFLRQAAASKTVPAVIDLVSEAYSPEAARGFFEKVTREILTQHGEIHRHSVDALEERVQDLDSRREALQREYADASELTQRLKESDPAQASVVAVERGRISATLEALGAEKPRLVHLMSRPATAPSELLGEITSPTRAVSPRKVMVAALSLLLGTLVGIVLAFFAEFVGGIRSSNATGR
jgi:uncharacterized protein involved in exopolysaccharide biosynthesis